MCSHCREAAAANYTKEEVLLMKRINAIYARQSVDRIDSISIDSQIEFCRFEVKDAEFKVYRDRGYSGKNTDETSASGVIFRHPKRGD